MSEEMHQLHFFRATNEYIEFLRGIDSKIMENHHDGRLRAYVGVLFTIGVHQYFAPLTSFKQEKHGHIKGSDQTCIIIKAKDKEEDTDEKKIALINLNNMFPIIPTEMTKILFKNESKKYKAFLEKEYQFVVSNQEKIIKRAKKLHTLVTVKKAPYIIDRCCDFTKLEQEYVKFNK